VIVGLSARDDLASTRISLGIPLGGKLPVGLIVMVSPAPGGWYSEDSRPAGRSTGRITGMILGFSDITRRNSTTEWDWGDRQLELGEALRN
jgi:hypothetical protein